MSSANVPFSFPEGEKQRFLGNRPAEDESDLRRMYMGPVPPTAGVTLPPKASLHKIQPHFTSVYLKCLLAQLGGSLDIETERNVTRTFPQRNKRHDFLFSTFVEF